jgi:hypothetical protein
MPSMPVYEVSGLLLSVGRNPRTGGRNRELEALFVSALTDERLIVHGQSPVNHLRQLHGNAPRGVGMLGDSAEALQAV